jgi:stalled ribosome rescue protein Dom34
MNNKKKFGVWMDSHHATVVGCENDNSDTLRVLAQVTSESSTNNSSEKNTHNHEKSIQSKFFKEIATHLVNAVHIHVTGTGQAQEQFIHFLAETPQFKNVPTKECTSTKMSDEKLVAFMETKF